MRAYSRKKSFFGALSFLTILALAAGPAAQQVVENPAKPAAANAGRIIPLKEVQRVTDQEGKFFFEQPLEVFAGKDGSVYVQEYKKLLKFDAAGKFVKNLLRWGEGPGELNDNLTNVLVAENKIILFSSNVIKAVRTDLQGKTIGSRKFSTGYFRDLIAYRAGTYYLTKIERMNFDRKPGLQEENYRLIRVDEAENSAPTPTLLPLTISWHRSGRGVSIMSINQMVFARADDRYVFLCHTPGYLVKLLDLESGEVVRSFRRDYKRVPFISRQKQPRGFEIEIPEYHNDICRLLMRGDRLWVVTSIFDKSKGILVDVFDREGRYLDNFYLPLLKIRRNNPGYYAPIAIHGNFLYILEAGEDDLISLIKYEIGGE